MKRFIVCMLLAATVALTACEKKKCSTKKCCNKCKTEQCCCKGHKDKCCDMCKK